MTDLQVVQSLLTNTADLPTQIRASQIPLVDKVWGKIVDLKSLSDNWDSYGALKPSDSAIKGALEISRITLHGSNIPLPDVVPVPNGNVQLEWSCLGIYLEVEIQSDTRLTVSFEDLDTGEEWEEELRFNLHKLTEAISALADKNLNKRRLQLVN